MEPVKFIVGVAKKEDMPSVKKDLQDKVDINFTRDLRSGVAFLAETDQATYEALWESKVELRIGEREEPKFPLDFLNPSSGNREVMEWYELSKPVIPDYLKGRVTFLELRREYAHQ